MPPAFHVLHPGSLYSHVLYSREGDHVFDLSTAVEVAEDMHGSDWSEVYNGLDGVERQ
jgi:hypothetical protein